MKESVLTYFPEVKAYSCYFWPFKSMKMHKLQTQLTRSRCCHTFEGVNLKISRHVDVLTGPGDPI